MFRYVTGFIASRSSHPILAGLLITAGLFAVAGVVVEQVLRPGVGSGFLIVYGILSASLGGIGYAALLIAGLASRLRRGETEDPLDVEFESPHETE
jgi:hypothetical protein